MQTLHLTLSPPIPYPVHARLQRHTAENIDKWTTEALESIGLKVDSLLGSDASADTTAISTINRTFLKPDHLKRLGIDQDTTDPDDFVFKKVSDNGANIKAAWDDGESWAPCIDHTIELCTLPFTYVERRKEAKIAKGSVAESFAKGRGLVGYLHLSSNAQKDFHTCQKRVGLPENSIDQDVKTRWRTAHNMADQLVFNQSAVLEMDKDPQYKDAGDVWGQNKLSFVDWDHLEQGSACLMEAAIGSQLLEGDEYPTASLVIPTTFRLMQYSSPQSDVFFRNRDEDEFNDAEANPVMVSHDELQPKIQEARSSYHSRLITRFDTELPVSVKKFWFVATVLDPRFKKLSFDGDRMLKPAHKQDAMKWLTEEYNNKYKHKTYDPSKVAADPPSAAAASQEANDADGGSNKRRKVSAASFFVPRVSRDESPAPAPAPIPPVEKDKPHKDELEAYLALPQIDYTSEWDAVEWWQENAKLFPNLAVMARQYMGCPASSATVERLFSAVGGCFSKKRRSAGAESISDLIFTKMNVD